MIRIETKKQIVESSFDYTNPIGNTADNYTNELLILEIEKYFDKNNLFILDIGCAGGQFVIDCINRGHNSFGIDGVDHVLNNENAAGHGNWKLYYNKNLFLSDAGSEYKLYDNTELIKFDYIHSWENIEHIFPENLDQYFINVYNNLKDDGIFIGSISTNPCEHHPSAFPYDFWVDKFKKNNLTFDAYLFENKLRDCGGSIYFSAKKIK